MALKWKKPLDLGFVDWRGVASREDACRREVQLNRRFAPDVYRDVLSVTDSDGRICEWVVLMRRMPAQKRLSTMINDGRLVDDALRAVAHALATHHASARRSARIDAGGTPAALLARWRSNLDALAENQLLDRAVLTTLTTLAHGYIAGRHPLLEARVAEGRVREGHGDLLADDIFCLEDGPRILDCLEFDEDLRAVDAIDDAAVLAMDLERLGAPELAHEFMRVFVEFTADPAPPSLTHHYIAYRAVMRAKIAAIRARQGDPDAATEVRVLAGIGLRHLQLGEPKLVVIGGLPGTGKTTLAGDLADAFEGVLLRSDRVRKESAGLDPNRADAATDDLYTAARNHQTYDLLLQRARRLLERGESVILDATWSSADVRARARAVAADSYADLRELCCVAPTDVADARIRERRAVGADSSDATPDVAHALAATFQAWPEATVIDTNQALADSCAAAHDALTTRA
ncbi:MAG TPA: AAA family ATPase [Microlunatus sp.]|nr:AAA family ATPase [Microlunatus sp.]